MVWARIHATEERLGKSLLITKKGGKKEGGSKLTPIAEDLLQRFDKIKTVIEKKTDLLFEEDMTSCLVIDSKKVNPPCC